MNTLINVCVLALVCLFHAAAAYPAESAPAAGPIAVPAAADGTEALEPAESRFGYGRYGGGYGGGFGYGGFGGRGFGYGGYGGHGFGGYRRFGGYGGFGGYRYAGGFGGFGYGK